MQDLADELGVSESRISQLRAEALLLLKDGMNSQLDPTAVAAEPRPNGRVARRKAATTPRSRRVPTTAPVSPPGPVEADEVVSQSGRRTASGGARI